jgi:hypothetical protein
VPTFTTPGMIAEMRRFSDGALDQTYTRVPTVAVVPDTDDGWGNRVTEAGPPVAGLPCKLRTVETVVRDDRGALLLRRPVLSIGIEDGLAMGDLVTDVRDGEGRLLLERAAVIRVDVAGVGGGTVGIAAELDGAEAVPLPAPGSG